MPRTTHINLNLIVDQSLKIIDRDGWERLTIKALSDDLGIKSPSIYNYFKNLALLNEKIFLQINDDMISFLIFSTDKNKKQGAILEFSRAYREYAMTYPERYKFYSFYPANNLSSFPSSSLNLRDFFAEIVKASFQISELEASHAIRTIRSYVHGFVMFELTGSWSNHFDLNESFEASIKLIVEGIGTLSANNKL